eukprot:g7076.t1
MFRFVLLSSLFVFSLPTSYADWLPNWSIRNLLQSEDRRNSDTTVQTRSFNLSCTWSDEIFCYLDYFEHIPDSDIKHFYIADEGCRTVLNKTLCESDPECQWTKLVGSDDEGCFARILQSMLELCSSTTNPAKGTLCSVWKQMNRCYQVQPSTQQSCRQLGRNTDNRCQWQDGTCFLHPKSLIQLEFLGDGAIADYISDVQDYCREAATREECESDHNIT